MGNTSILGKIIVALTTMPQYWGLLLDVIEKMANQDFAKELPKFARKETCWVKVATIKIVHGLDPVKFFGGCWNVEEAETDSRSVVITELDLNKVKLVTMLRDGETSITGEENHRRLKAINYIRLNIDVFFMLWGNKYLIPEAWKEKINGSPQRIYFEGTIFRDSEGHDDALCMYWYDDAWHWSIPWLGLNRGLADVIAVIEES